MSKMKVLSITLDQETIDRIAELQKKTGVFSRSEIVRNLIAESLENKQQAG